MGKSDIVFIIVESDKQIIGFCQGIIEQSYGGKMGLLDKIYLNSNYRCKSVGTQVSEYLIKEMKKQKIYFLEWRCSASNVASVKLAEKIGLKPFSLRYRKNIK